MDAIFILLKSHLLHFLKVQTWSLDVLDPRRPTAFPRGDRFLGQAVAAAAHGCSPPGAALLTGGHQTGRQVTQ